MVFHIKKKTEGQIAFSHEMKMQKYLGNENLKKN